MPMTTEKAALLAGPYRGVSLDDVVTTGSKIEAMHATVEFTKRPIYDGMYWRVTATATKSRDVEVQKIVSWNVDLDEAVDEAFAVFKAVMGTR